MEPFRLRGGLGQRPWGHSGRPIRTLGIVLLMMLLPPATAHSDSGGDQVEGGFRTLSMGEAKEAVELLRARVTETPSDLDAQLQYGKALISAREESLAVWSLLRATAHPTEGDQARLLLGIAQLSAGSAADAIRTATELLSEDPEHTRALSLRARALLREKREEDALEDLDLLADLVGVEDENAAIEALQLRLEALLALNLEVEASDLVEDFYTKVREDDRAMPGLRGRVCAGRAVFAAERGDPEEAERRFDECLETEGYKIPALIRTAAEFFDGRGDWERGTQVWRDAVGASPTNIPLLVRLTDRLQLAGRVTEAEGLLLTTAEIHPTAWSALIDLYLSKGDVESALHAMDESIRQIPEYPALWDFTRADMLVVLGRLDEAEQAIEKLSTPVYRHIAKGHLLLVRDQPKEALVELENGVRLWPNNSDARFLAGLASDHLLDRDRAVAHYREAARVDRPHKPAVRALVDHHLRRREWGLAVQVLRRLTAAYPSDPEGHEIAIRIARRSGNEQLGRQHLNALAALPGQAGRVLALAMQIARDAAGDAASLETAQKSGLDLSNPAHRDALMEMTKSQVALGKFDEALALLRRAEAASPEDRSLRAHRASVLAEAGRGDEARALVAAIGADPLENPSAALSLARTAATLGLDVPETLQLFENAAKSAGDDFEAVRETVKFETAHGRASAAASRLREWVREHPRDGAAASVLAELLLDRPEMERDASEIELLARRVGLFHDASLAQEISRRRADRI